MTKIFLLTGAFVFLLDIILTTIVVLKYDYKSVMEFRPTHEVTSLALLFGGLVFVYSSVFRAWLHFPAWACLMLGSIIGCFLHGKEIRDAMRMWRLNHRG